MTRIRRLRAKLPPSASRLAAGEERIEKRIDALAENVDGLVRGLDRLESRLDRLKWLAVRAHEAPLLMAERLAAARASPPYERAYSEAEPLVSIRIATIDNAGLLVERTLASVLAQTYENWEAVVVGDACEDDTATRIGAIGDARIRFINLPTRGAYPEDPMARWHVAGIPPMNAGLDAAQGDWIAPLDHDDEFDPDHIERLLSEVRARGLELAYARMRVAIEGERRLAHFGAWPPAQGGFSFQSAIHHRALRIFRYDSTCHLQAEPGDWNLARRMREAGVQFGFVDDVVGTYHVPASNPRHGYWVSRAAEDPLDEL